MRATLPWLLLCLCACDAPKHSDAHFQAQTEAARATGEPGRSARLLLEGIVLDPEGRPVSGARVAINPGAGTQAGSDRAVALAWSAPDGRFRFEGLAQGMYALTATAPRFAAAYVERVALTAGETPSVSLRLSPARTTLSGAVRLPPGVPDSAVQIRALRTSQHAGDIFYAEPVRGHYAMGLPEGSYTLLLEGAGVASLPSWVQLESSRTLDLALETPGAATPEVLTWLRGQAVPLGDEGEGLDSVQRWMRGARLLLMGEATHGTHEFFALRRQLLERLVAEEGVRVLALEEGFALALSLDAYVCTGAGNPRELLRPLFFFSNSEEMLDLLQWMRQYNARAAGPCALRIRGFDIQKSGGSLRAARQFLAQVDPAFASGLDASLAALEQSSLSEEFRAWERTAQERALSNVVRMRERLAQQRVRFSRRTSAEAWKLALRHAVVAEQGLRLQLSERASNFRDEAMAENLSWLLDEAGGGARVVAWAHNMHVRVRDENVRYSPMGAHLRQRLGAGVFSLGFALNEGTVLAMQERSARVESFRIEPGPPASLDATLAAVGPERLALDLRQAPAPGPVAEWLGARRLSRSIGARFGPETAERSLFPVAPLVDHDALLFVAKTRALRPL